MTSPIVLIMAHGQQERLPALTHPKHLLPLGSGETILSRNLRLCRELTDSQPVLIAPRHAGFVDLENAGLLRIVTCTEKVPTLLDTLACIRTWWQRRDAPVALLLGDVVFSRAAMALALARAPTERVTFVGRAGANRVTGKRYGELFGMCIPPGADITAFAAAFARVREAGGGKLWDLYYKIAKVRAPMPTPFLLDPQDYTDDVDTPVDVETVLPRLVVAAAADDESPSLGVQGAT